MEDKCSLGGQQHQQLLLSERRRTFSLISGATMVGQPWAQLTDADIALLPHVNWSQITVAKFIGSGAFGEVYEGLLNPTEEEANKGGSAVIKVAIKVSYPYPTCKVVNKIASNKSLPFMEQSLRKGASEFSELLQEAQLMSKFRHDNIVSLIGVCCDTDSISIIMEHMNGGDLLNYLRELRSTVAVGLPLPRSSSVI